MNIKVWEEGKKGELAFWRGWLINKSAPYQNPLPLLPLFDFMIGKKKEVTIANLGAGAMCIIGNVRQGVKVDVVSSDLLADEYEKLRKEQTIKVPTPVEKQDMTNLTYKDNAFDIVFCSNTLDHSQDPYKALTEMVRICKPGGWIYLRHIAHEGKRHNYRNLHQWNLDITEDNDCIIWNKEDFLTATFLLSDIYPGFTTEVEVRRSTLLVTSFVQKK